MGEKFFLAFIAKNTLEELRQLFDAEKLSLDVLHALIDKLAEHGHYDHLQWLLHIITEDKNKDKISNALLCHVHHKFLISNLYNFNQKNITLHLQKLTTLLTNEQDYHWQEILSEVIIWLDFCTPNEFKQFLEQLSFDARDKLYQLLVKRLDSKPSWLNTLIDFVLVERNVLTAELKQHLSELAAHLLLATLDCDAEIIRNLSLRLGIEELITITFKLRAIAATYSNTSNKDKKKSGGNTRLRQLYLHNHETLATALTARAMDLANDYQALVQDNNELANLLMTNRLQASDNTPEDLKTLVNELLANFVLFNWQDGAFHELAIHCIVKVLATLSDKELQLYFAFYYAHCDKKTEPQSASTTPIASAPFIDRMYVAFTTENNDEGAQRLINCLRANDDSDNTLIVNYLMHGQAYDTYIYGQCLRCLSIEQLIALCGPLLQQVLQKKEPSLKKTYSIVFCEKIIATPNTQEILTKLAHTTSLLDITSQQELVAMLIAQLDKPELNYWYLEALHAQQQAAIAVLRSQLADQAKPDDALEKELTAKQCELNLLLPYYRSLFKIISLDMQVKLLKQFSAATVFAFYLYLIDHHAHETEFNSLFELFRTDFERQPIFNYILTNTPLIEQSFFEKALAVIGNKDIITLIEVLIDKVEDNPDYLYTLNQLLIYFCARLQETSNEKDPIHEWIICDKVSSIAGYLLANPVCVVSLSTGSSWFWGLDLKLRAVRLFDLLPSLEKENAQQTALSLLGHYRQDYTSLHTLFRNLEAVKEQFSEQGKQNYQAFKTACWSLLTTVDHDVYKEKDATEMLTAQLGTPHRFDKVLAQLVANLSSNNSTAGAQYLTQIEDKSLQKIEKATLITILCQSMDNTTRINWEKTASFLHTKTTDEIIAFVEALLKYVANYLNNPLLTHQTWLFVTKLSEFTTLLPRLDNFSLQWLVQHGDPDVLVKDFPNWFNTLLIYGKLELLHFGPLFARLPPDRNFLEKLMQHEKLTPYLPQIFCDLANQESTTEHLVVLYGIISTLDQALKKELIQYVHQHLQAQKMLPMVATVLNNILLTDLLRDLQPQNKDDVNLILKQLRFFERWGSTLSPDTPEYAAYMPELRQLLFNLFNALSAADSPWRQHIFNTKVFAKLALFLLPDNSTNVQHHPFTSLLLTNITAKLHPKLLTSTPYQHYITQLLLHPPKALQDEQFALLFQTLSEQEQINFARHMLSQPTLDNRQWSALLIVARVLPMKELFAIYKNSQTRFIFVDLLVRHPEGIGNLTVSEKSELLDNLDSAQQLVRILDSQTAVRVKFDFVSAIFAHLDHRKISLTMWFEQLNSDGQTLAAFANYTEKTLHHDALSHYLQQSPARLLQLKTYLQQPTLDMRIEQKGMLYDFLRKAWVKPQLGCQCHPETLAMLSLKDASLALKNQLRFLSATQQLPAFYTPLAGCQEAANTLLIAARWIQRLPLLTDGLLPIIETCEKGEPAVVAQIQQTAIYQRLIAFLKNDTRVAIETQLGELFTLLTAYDQWLGEAQLKNTHPYLRATLLEYQLELSAIEHQTSVQLLELFSPHSNFAKTKNGITASLVAEESLNLANAYRQHQNAKRRYTPQHYLITLLNTIPKKVMAEPQMQQWLVEECLFSPLLEPWDTLDINRLFAASDSEKLCSILKDINKNIISYQQCFTLLANFNTCKTMEELLAELATLDNKTLRRCAAACEFTKLPYLVSSIGLTIQLKKTATPTAALLLPKELSRGLEMEWVAQDLCKLDQRSRFLTKRLQQIKIAAFSYQDNPQDWVRLSNLPVNLSENKEFSTLAQCLNSYLPAFTKKQTKTIASVMLALDNLLQEPLNCHTFLLHLDGRLIEDILSAALDSISNYEPLIEQFIIHNLGERCLLTLETFLYEQLMPYVQPMTENKYSLDLTSLTVAQLVQLPEGLFEELYIVQKLIYMIKPSPQLREWLKNTQAESRFSRVFFCANAGLYALLMQLKQQCVTAPDEIRAIAQPVLSNAFSSLHQTAQKTRWEDIGKELATKPDPNPAINYYYASLSAFLAEDSSLLVNTFVTWFCQADNTFSHELSALLKDIMTEQLLDSLCQQLAQHPLDEAKCQWLFEQAKTMDPTNLGIILGAMPWEWVRKKIRAPSENSILLLQLALQQETLLGKINLDTATIASFLALFEECRIDLNALISLQQTLTNPIIRSLLALYCLSRSDYLKILSEPAFTPAASSTQRLKQRLKPVIEQLDCRHLTPELLKNFEPEAAASLLCSPYYFHLLDEGLLKTLLNKSELSLAYWLRFYSAMPNAYRPLASMIALNANDVLKALKTLDTTTHQQLLMLIIAQYDQFDASKTQKIVDALLGNGDEAHLVYAVNRYMHDKNHQPALIPIIKALVEKIPTPSSATTNLLIRLTDDEAFADLRERFNKEISNQVKNNAILGDCSLFYENGKFVKQSALKPIALLNGEEVQNVHAINYFLHCYRGQTQPLQQLLGDYLRQQRDKALLQESASLLVLEGVAATTQQLLFTALLQRHHRATSHTAAYLARFDTRATIAAWGQHKNYLALVQLFEDTQPHLQAYPAALQLLEQAAQEAAFENDLSELWPWFKNWRIWFKRCSFYGWTGWFKPNKPQFVTSFDEEEVKEEPLATIEEDHDDDDEGIDLTAATPQLSALFNTSCLDPLDQLTQFHDALLRYEFAPKDQHEIADRSKVEKLFVDLQNYPKHAEWLVKHHQAFSNNREKLIALLCQHDDRAALKELFVNMADNAYCCKSMREELFAAQSASLRIPSSEDNNKTLRFVGNMQRLFPVSRLLHYTPWGRLPPVNSITDSQPS